MHLHSAPQLSGKIYICDPSQNGTNDRTKPGPVRFQVSAQELPPFSLEPKAAQSNFASRTPLVSEYDTATLRHNSTQLHELGDTQLAPKWSPSPQTLEGHGPYRDNRGRYYFMIGKSNSLKERFCQQLQHWKQIRRCRRASRSSPNSLLEVDCQKQDQLPFSSNVSPMGPFEIASDPLVRQYAELHGICSPSELEARNSEAQDSNKISWVSSHAGGSMSPLPSLVDSMSMDWNSSGASWNVSQSSDYSVRTPSQNLSELPGSFFFENAVSVRSDSFPNVNMNMCDSPIEGDFAIFGLSSSKDDGDSARRQTTGTLFRGTSSLQDCTTQKSAYPFELQATLPSPRLSGDKKRSHKPSKNRLSSSKQAAINKLPIDENAGILRDRLQKEFDYLVRHFEDWSATLDQLSQSLVNLTVLSKLSLDDALTAANALYNPCHCEPNQKVLLSLFTCALTLATARNKTLEHYAGALHREGIDWASDIEDYAERRIYCDITNHIWLSAFRDALSVRTSKHQTCSRSPSLSPRLRVSENEKYHLLVPASMMYICQVGIELICKDGRKMNLEPCFLDPHCLTEDAPPSFKDHVYDEIIIPLQELPDYQSLDTSRMTTYLQQGVLKNFCDIQSSLKQEFTRSSFASSQTKLRSVLDRCQTVAGIYGHQTIEWLRKALQRSAYQVVSDPPSTFSHKQVIVDTRQAQTPLLNSPRSRRTQPPAISHRSSVSFSHHTSPTSKKRKRAQEHAEPRQMIGAPEVPSFECSVCGNVFSCSTRKDSYRRHMRESHSGKRFQCSYCEISYSRANAKNQHEKVIHGATGRSRTRPRNLT